MEPTSENYLLNQETVELLGVNAEDLSEAELLAADMTHEFRHTSELQAQGMARSAQIELSLEDVRLYSALRELLPASMGGSVRTGDPSRFACILSDQHLLAEVLRQSGDTERLMKFVSFYPNIFPQSPKGEGWFVSETETSK